jgi:hypothetical protein
MLLEASYLSRSFAKFVEIIAAGLATAISAYFITQLGGPLSATMPAPAAVSAGSTAGEVATALPAQPVPPVAAAAVDERRPAPHSGADAPPAQPARKAVKTAMAAAAPKESKTGTSVARGEKSVEALTRAALANFDADRPAPAAAPARRVPSGTSSAAPAAAEVQLRAADMPPRQAVIQPPPTTVEAQSRRVAALDPLPPNAGSPPEIAAPRPEPPADEVKGLFSVPKRMLHLLRPGTPSLADEAPRPPMPVATAPRE